MCKSATAGRLLCKPWAPTAHCLETPDEPVTPNVRRHATPQHTSPMRTRTFILWSLLAPAAVGAQGWIIPRPCVRPLEDRVRPGVLACPSVSVVRTRSDVRARMDGARAIHYEVEERFVNRGNVVGEADYMFPL